MAFNWIIKWYSAPSQSVPIPSSQQARMSAFNFCNSYDEVLPLVNGEITNVDRYHLWGNYLRFIITATGGPYALQDGRVAYGGALAGRLAYGGPVEGRTAYGGAVAGRIWQ
jgi:hypothetical protein